MSEYIGEYVAYSLGRCPECDSLRLGIIEPSYGRSILEQNKKALYYYKKYRCYYKMDTSKDWEEGFSANRFCMDCKNEWYESGKRKKRFSKLIFSNEESFEDFLQQKCFFDEEDFHNIHRKEHYRQKEIKMKWYTKLGHFIKKSFLSRL